LRNYVSLLKLTSDSFFTKLDHHTNAPQSLFVCFGKYRCESRFTTDILPKQISGTNP
jgi:hypothetical protein